MRIEGTPFPNIDGVNGVKRPSPVAKDKTGVGADKAAVSGKAQLYSSLVAKTKQIMDTSDKEKLQNLMEAVGNGTYTVDSHAIARKLLGL